MPLTQNAIAYAWQQLAERSGISPNGSDVSPFDTLGVTIHYAKPEEVVHVERGIIVVPCTNNAWHDLCKKQPNTLSWVSPDDICPNQLDHPIDAPVPVLFWGDGYEDGGKPFVEKDERGCVIFYVDIVASTFFMLSRWEESVATRCDSHNRFLAADSVAYRQGFIEHPVIDYYGLILQVWLQALLPEWQPKRRTFSVQLSHDIDFVRRFQDTRKIIGTLARNIIRQRNLATFWATLKDAYASNFAIEHDSYFRGIYDLANLSSRLKLKSVFNFMAVENDPYQTGYNPNQAHIRACIQYLIEQGHEIGFHAGYYTYNDTDQFQLEKSRLDAVVAPSVLSGGRQHFLRFHVPDTWRCWVDANLAYDSSLGYAGHEGFRCGTCHPFLVFDLERDQVFPLIEVPLIVMDSTLRVYRNLTPQEGAEQILRLAKRCAQVDGLFTLLWHNSSLSGEWAEWAVTYEVVLKQLAALQHSDTTRKPL